MDALNFRLALNVVTRSPEVLTSIFERIDGDDVLKPDYWGSDERKREVWTSKDAEAALQRSVADRGLFFWRKPAPSYTGHIAFTDHPVNDYALEFDGKKVGRHGEAIFAKADEWAREYPVVFGFVHPVWKGQTPGPYNVGVHAGSRDIEKKGLASVFARTYFGPWLVERIGKSRLMSWPTATELPSGTVRVDLIEKPWEGTFEVLSEAKARLLAIVRDAGILAEGPRGYTLAEPAPRWENPGWHPGKKFQVKK